MSVMTMVLFFKIGFLEITLKDSIDILLVTILLYHIYKLIRNSGIFRLFVGVLLIYISYLIINALQMTLLSKILSQFIEVGFIAAIVIFQKEIRKILIILGDSNVFKISTSNLLFFWKKKKYIYSYIQTIIDAVEELSLGKEGGLIVINKNTLLEDMDDIIHTGERIEAIISKRLILNIFFKNSPLHDGGMIIQNNKIVAAGCVFPLSESVFINRNLGLRHRAAMGITEIYNVLSICVSEESGEISVIEKGTIVSGVSKQELKQIIDAFLQVSKKV